MTLDPRKLDPEGLHAQTRSLRALAQALVGDGHDADDVVQEAWLTSLGRPPKRGWSLASWLSGITRNHARQQAREQQRRTRRELAAARPEVQPPDDSIERIDVLRHLLDQVRGLDEPYRSTILLRFFDGLSPKEVARRQGVPHATVRTHLHRGIEMLRRRMDQTTQGGRQAWLVPLAPFVSVPDAVPITTLTDGAARLVEAGTQGVLAMSVKTKVVGLALLLGAGLLTVTLSPMFDDPAVEDPGPGEPSLASTRQADLSSGALEGQPSVPGDRKLIGKGHVGKDSAPGKGEPKEFLRVIVQGVVRTEKGTPLAGAVVTTGKRKTTTAEDGSYSLAARYYQAKDRFNTGFKNKLNIKQEGRVSIRASARGHCSVSQRLPVPSGQSPVEMDFTLRPGFLVTGRVTTPDGEGIGGAWVRMYPTDAQTVRTDDHGWFRVEDIDARTPKHYLEAIAKGYLPAGKSIDTAGKTAEQGLVLVLKQGSVVRGIVCGPHREPVAGAKLSMSAGKMADVHAISDQRGAFELTGVWPGKQTLTVQHDEYAPTLRQIEVPPPGNDLDVVINLLLGETLSGVVRDSHGALIAGAAIDIGLEWRTVGKAVTNDRGVFEARGLPAGDLALNCRAEGYLTTRQRVKGGRRDVLITLERSARIAGRVVDAQTNQPVRGFTVRFVALAEKTPAKGGKSGAGEAQSFSDPEGQWVADGVPVGFVTGLEIRADGYAPAFVPRVVARVDARYDDLSTSLEAGTTVEGRVVVDATSKPVAGATVKIVRAYSPLDPDSYKDSGRRMTRCDAEGRFQLPNVGPGALRLAIEHEEWGLLLHALDIVPGTPRTDVTVRVDSQGTLVGAVKDVDGRPAPEVHVRLSAVRVPGLLNKAWQTRADGHGRFTFSFLPDGIYLLAHSKGGKGAKGGGKKSSGMVSRYVRITGSKRLDVVLTAAGGARLVGKVIPPGELPPYLYVTLTPQYPEEIPWEERQPPEWTMVRTDTFTFEGVRPGHFRIDVYEKARGPQMHGRTEIDVTGTGEQRIEVRLTQPNDR